MTHAMPPQQIGAFASLQTTVAAQPWTEQPCLCCQDGSGTAVSSEGPDETLHPSREDSAKYPHIQAFFHRENHKKSYSSTASVQTAVLKHH